MVFVHIPLLPEQSINGSSPTMELEQIVRGLMIAAQSIIDNEQDL